MITRLQISNFKSLRELDLQLGPVNVLVGPNMGGKSNIIDVFRFLQELIFSKPAHEGLSYALAQRGGIGELILKGSDESLVRICLEADFKKGRTKCQYELEIIGGRGGFAQIQKESLKVFEGSQSADLIVEEGSSRWLTNVSGQKLVSTTWGRSVLQNAPENWDGYDLTESVRSWRFYQFVPQIMKELNPTGSGEVLEPHGRNLSAWLMVLQTRYPDAFARIDEVARDVFPDLRALLTWPTQQGTVHLAAREMGLNRPVNVWQMSDGELSFLALLSLIYSPDTLGAPLFCIEEPENHLHPRLLSVLVKLMRQVRTEIESRGELAQLVITTHSPLLVDQMRLDEIIWVAKKNGATFVLRPSDHKHLQKLLEDKDLGMADVIYSGLLAEER